MDTQSTQTPLPKPNASSSSNPRAPQLCIVTIPPPNPNPSNQNIHNSGGSQSGIKVREVSPIPSSNQGRPQRANSISVREIHDLSSRFFSNSPSPHTPISANNQHIVSKASSLNSSGISSSSQFESPQQPLRLANSMPPTSNVNVQALKNRSSSISSEGNINNAGSNLIIELKILQQKLIFEQTKNEQLEDRSKKLEEELERVNMDNKKLVEKLSQFEQFTNNDNNINKNNSKTLVFGSYRANPSTSDDSLLSQVTKATSGLVNILSPDKK